MSFPGCCTPQNVCGALDSSSGGFGCIPGDEFPMGDGGAGAGQSCTYDPTITCTGILDARCDGPEDCGSGEQCCSHSSGGSTQLTCETSCADLTAAGTRAQEICHPGGSCEPPPTPDGGTTSSSLPDGGAPAYACRTSGRLPDFLYRCSSRTASPEATEVGSMASGEVNCGDRVCGTGEKCCFIATPAPSTDGAAAPSSTNGTGYCAPVDEARSCRPDSDGDAG